MEYLSELISEEDLLCLWLYKKSNLTKKKTTTIAQVTRGIPLDTQHSLLHYKRETSESQIGPKLCRPIAGNVCYCLGRIVRDLEQQSWNVLLSPFVSEGSAILSDWGITHASMYWSVADRQSCDCTPMYWLHLPSHVPVHHLHLRPPYHWHQLSRALSGRGSPDLDASWHGCYFLCSAELRTINENLMASQLAYLVTMTMSLQERGRGCWLIKLTDCTIIFWGLRRKILLINLWLDLLEQVIIVIWFRTCAAFKNKTATSLGTTPPVMWRSPWLASLSQRCA